MKKLISVLFLGFLIFSAFPLSAQSNYKIARKMRITQVDSVAGGRVWTGNSALKAGLVDRHIVGNIVAVIAQWRWIKGKQPDGGDT